MYEYGVESWKMDSYGVVGGVIQTTAILGR